MCIWSLCAGYWIEQSFPSNKTFISSHILPPAPLSPLFNADYDVGHIPSEPSMALSVFTSLNSSFAWVRLASICVIYVESPRKPTFRNGICFVLFYQISYVVEEKYSLLRLVFISQIAFIFYRLLTGEYLISTCTVTVKWWRSKSSNARKKIVYSPDERRPSYERIKPLIPPTRISAAHSNRVNTKPKRELCSIGNYAHKLFASVQCMFSWVIWCLPACLGFRWHFQAYKSSTPTR